MNSDLWKTILLAAGGIGLLAALTFLPQGFWRFCAKVLLNCALGFLAICVINLVGVGAGVALPFNWFTLVVSGVLGVPGVAALAGISYCV